MCLARKGGSAAEFLSSSWSQTRRLEARAQMAVAQSTTRGMCPCASPFLSVVAPRVRCRLARTGGSLVYIHRVLHRPLSSFPSPFFAKRHSTDVRRVPGSLDRILFSASAQTISQPPSSLSAECEFKNVRLSSSSETGNLAARWRWRSR
jgi:hypothetical protein